MRVHERPATDPHAGSPSLDEAPYGDERDHRVRRVILVEGAVNAALAISKVAVGLGTGSMAILGDAVHSVTDLMNNAVAWVALRWSAAPPDAAHPYGHRKFETVAVFLLAVLLAVTAFELGTRALGSDKPVVVPGDWALASMLGALAANVALAIWQGRWARRLDSDILHADARHTVSDVLTTLVAIAGWQAAAHGYPWVDTLAAVVVMGLILVLAFGLFRRSLPVLVDQAPIAAERIEAIAATVPGVAEVASPRSRSIGRQAVVDVVVRVAPHLDTVASHAIATRVEQAIREQLPVAEVVVHVEPTTPTRHATDPA